MARIAKSLSVMMVALLLAILPIQGVAQSRDHNPIEAGNILDEIVPAPGTAWVVGVP